MYVNNNFVVLWTMPSNDQSLLLTASWITTPGRDWGCPEIKLESAVYKASAFPAVLLLQPGK